MINRIGKKNHKKAQDTKTNGDKIVESVYNSLKNTTKKMTSEEVGSIAAKGVLNEIKRSIKKEQS